MKIMLFVLLLSTQIFAQFYSPHTGDRLDSAIVNATRGRIEGVVHDTANVLRGEWKSDISDSISNFSTYSPSVTIREVGSDRDYTTISSAITASSSGDIIKVFSGTYTEQVTISKNLTLDLTDNAILNYTTASTGATLIVNSGITAVIYGGKIQRNTTTSTSKVIQNAGNLYLYDTQLYHSSNSQYTYTVYSTGGNIYANNIDYQSPYYYGGTYLNATGGYINAKNFLGFINFDSSRVNITCDNWFQMWSGFNRSDIMGNSIVSFTVRHKMGKLPISGNLDSLYNGNLNGWIIYSYNSAEITFRDGVFALWIYPYGSNKINLINVHNDNGIPSIRSFPSTNTTQYWTIQNSTLNYVPASWSSYKDNGAGNHMLEFTPDVGVAGYLYAKVENSVFNFGDPDYQNRDSVRITGNFIQLVGYGSAEFSNNILKEYPNKGFALAYQPFGYLGKKDMRFSLTNNTIEIFGDGKFMGYLAFEATGNIDLRIIGNIISLKDNGANNNFIFGTSAVRIPSASDTVFISGNTYLSDYGNPKEFYYADPTYIDSEKMDSLLGKSKSSYDILKATKNYSRGFAYPTADLNNYLISYGEYLDLSDTLSRAGIDGDSLLVKIYLLNDKRTSAGSYRGNQIDTKFSIYPHGAPSTVSNKNSLYDIRYFAGTMAGGNADKDYYFKVDTVFSATYEKCYVKFTIGTQSYGIATTANDDYITFYVNNLNNYPIELGILGKELLNVRKIEVTRF